MVYVWFISFSMIISKWHHFFMAELYSIVYMYHILFIHLSMGIYLASVLVMVNSPATNTKPWGYIYIFKLEFSQIYAQEWDCKSIWQLYFYFFKELAYYFPQWLYQFTFLPTVQEASLFREEMLNCRLNLTFGKFQGKNRRIRPF